MNAGATRSRFKLGPGSHRESRRHIQLGPEHIQFLGQRACPASTGLWPNDRETNHTHLLTGFSDLRALRTRRKFAHQYYSRWSIDARKIPANSELLAADRITQQEPGGKALKREIAPQLHNNYDQFPAGQAVTIETLWII